MNILTVDMDFLLKDMVEIQSNIQIDGDYPIDRYWAGIHAILGKKKLPLWEGAEKFVEDILNAKCADAGFFVVEKHHEIIPILRDLDAKDVLLVNIDYHHDIDYAGEYNLSEENWVSHAYREGMVKTYSWITHADAKVCTTTPFSHETRQWNVNISLDDFPEFNFVVLCKSPHFFPPEHWHILERWSK